MEKSEVVEDETVLKIVRNHSLRYAASKSQFAKANLCHSPREFVTECEGEREEESRKMSVNKPTKWTLFHVICLETFKSLEYFQLN